MSARLVYKDLLASDAIRLLLLQPASQPNPVEIHCKLFYTSLTDQEEDFTLQYTALSYVWGDERQQREIFVDGISHHVTLNLFNALRSLRHELRELPLWVDAVCINQQNIPERNQQVRSMGAIYASARNTVIYLGESDENSDWVVQTLRDTSPKASNSTRFKSCLNSSILSRPWFMRVWVLQELVLSQNPIIQCGPSRVKWAKLPQFLGREVSVHHEVGTGLPGVDSIIVDMQRVRDMAQSHGGERTAHGGNPKHMLFDIVHSRRGLGAKDPRDIIFAYIGMFSSFKSQGMESALKYRFFETVDLVDYTKSVAEVYNNFARIIIQDKFSLSISIRVQETFPQKSFINGLGSWAPDWSLAPQQVMSKLPRFYTRYTTDLLRLFSTKKFEFIELRDSTVLAVIGSRWTMIQDTRNIVERGDPSLLKIEEMCKELSTRSTTIRVIAKLYHEIYQELQKILGERFLPRLDESFLFTHILSSTLEYNRFTWALGYRKDISFDSQSLADYIIRGSHSVNKARGDNVLLGRRIALLANGSTALVPAAARKGDICCVIGMDPGTIILRPDNQPRTLDVDFICGLEPLKERVRLIRSEPSQADFIPCDHAALIGECLVDGLTEVDAEISKIQENPQIFALH